MSKKLKPYVAIPHKDSDWGILVISKLGMNKTKNLAYQNMFECDSYIDIRITRLPEHTLKLTNPKWLEKGISHVIDNPVSCVNCDFWGYGVVDGLCGGCGEHPGKELIKLYEN
jgi:hypothetical protein